MKAGKCYFCGAALLGFLLMTGYAARPGPSRGYVPRPDGRYDSNTFLVDPSHMTLSRVASSFVTLQTKTRFEMPDGEVIEHRKEGSGLILDGRFVLTVEHVVAHHEIAISTPLGLVQLPVKKKVSEETFFRWKGTRYPLRPVYVDRGEDIALLEIPSGVHPPSFPYQTGDSDDLQVGNFVYVIGNPLNIGINVREGIVSALEAPSEASEAGVKPKNAFMVSNGLMPGDSGSPIIAIRDGRFELVGISQGTIKGNTRLSWAIRINVIRNLLRTARTALPGQLLRPKRTGRTSGRKPGGAEGVGFFFGAGRQAEGWSGDPVSLRPLLPPSGGGRGIRRIRNMGARGGSRTGSRVANLCSLWRSDS